MAWRCYEKRRRIKLKILKINLFLQTFYGPITFVIVCVADAVHVVDGGNVAGSKSNIKSVSVATTLKLKLIIVFFVNFFLLYLAIELQHLLK